MTDPCLLAVTGGGPLTIAVAAALVLLACGAVVVLRSRRAKVSGVLVIALLAAVGLGLGGAPAAQAADTCATPSSSTTAPPTQTPTPTDTTGPVRGTVMVTWHGMDERCAPSLAGVPQRYVVLSDDATQSVLAVRAFDPLAGRTTFTDLPIPSSPRAWLSDSADPAYGTEEVPYWYPCELAGVQFQYALSPFSSIDPLTAAAPDSDANAWFEGPNCAEVNDKSNSVDTDGDGVHDTCDLDSDNDGIPDDWENRNGNASFQDDDAEGDPRYIQELGDGIPNYLDLDSDNDGVLDLFESGIPRSVIDQIDKDHDGVIDADVEVGLNGLADVLETFPDSGVAAYTLRDTDGDDIPDFLGLTSNGTEFDLYRIGKAHLDRFGGGFLSRTPDDDRDGIMNSVDTNLVVRGAPGSPLGF